MAKHPAKLLLSIGSNLGDRPAILASAVDRIVSDLGPIAYASAVMETAAWGKEDQPSFLNQVVGVSLPLPPPGPETAATLHRMLDVTQCIETAHGRERHQHWGPRTLDIDLIYFGDLVYEDARISLPHPWRHQRPFVYGLLPPGPDFDRYIRIFDDGE